MNLLIVFYHYFGNEQQYRAGIYPVSPERFSRQLDGLGKTFQFISEKDLVDAIERKNSLPEKSCLITLDDGLRCQYEQAVPVLKNKGVPAVFYINTQPLELKKACIVHKIHFLLANLPTGALLNEIEKYYFQLTGRKLKVIEMSNQLRRIRGIDDESTFKLKYLINSYLEPELSAKIIDYIFRNNCGSEAKFCEQWYMNKKQLLEIKKNKKFALSLHLASHLNIPAHSSDRVSADLADNFRYFSRELLMEKVNGIAYPYGRLSQSDIKKKIMPAAAAYNLKYGLTTYKGINNNLKAPYSLKRFDTNDVVGGKGPIIDFK